MEMLLALDAGTTGVTGVIYDVEMRSRLRAYREFPQSFPEPGWVEHDANDILAAVDAVLAELLQSPQGANVVAIGITNQRETVFALDLESGQAIRPGIVWQDRRTADRCEELRDSEAADRIRSLTGLVIDPYFSATKIEWMLAHDSSLRERAAAGWIRFCTVDTLVIHHLTGGGEVVTDPTNASRTMLFDLDRRAWDEGLCELFGVRRDWLAEVRPSAGDFGETSAEVVGRKLPIRGVAGDQQAALFGQGCVDAGALKCTFGTGCFLLLHTGAERVESRRGLLTTLAVAGDGSSAFALEGSIFVAGAALQWLRDGLQLIETASESEQLARSVADTGGVFLIPAFAGLGAPYWDAGARGALLGLTRGTQRAHVARAALEAIAFQNADLIEVLREESGLGVQSLLVDGGASANDLLMELQASFAQVCVSRPRQVEATARGAALLAGIGVGLIRDPSSPLEMREPAQSFEPALRESEAAQRLVEWRAAVQRVRSAE